MPKKDININVNTPGAEESERKLDKVGRAGKKVGEQISDGSKKAADSTDKSNQKLRGMNGTLSDLQTQIKGAVGAWLGMEGVQKILSEVEERLGRINELQSNIYENSVKLGTAGQGLEIQTGSAGKQTEWTRKAAQLQKAGGLKDIQTAKEMMVAMDIAFNDRGGVDSPQIMALGSELAPFVGANQMNSEQVSKLLNFAGTAGIEPNAEAYKQFFAKLQAGWTSSKSQDFGDFLTSLQEGGTSYVGQGGSLEGAISGFSSALSVSSGEANAATLLEQATRFASGAYKKPREAVEASQDVQWGNLSMDQRMNALLTHVGSLPQSSRIQTMIEQGFEPGLASELAKMVTPDAQATMQSTRNIVSEATPQLIEKQMQAYLTSDLGKERSLSANQNILNTELGPEFGNWQRRLKEAKLEFDRKLATGKDDKLIRDVYEPYAIALQDMADEVDALLEKLPEGSPAWEEARDFRDKGIYIMRSNIVGPLAGRIPGTEELLKKIAKQQGHKLEQQWGEMKQGLSLPQGGNDGNTTIINNNNQTIYTPRVGSDQRGPRFTQD